MCGNLASSLLGSFQGLGEQAAALHQGMFVGHRRAQRSEDPFGLHLMARFGHDNLQQAMLMQLHRALLVPERRAVLREIIFLT